MNCASKILSSTEIGQPTGRPVRTHDDRSIRFTHIAYRFLLLAVASAVATVALADDPMPAEPGAARRSELITLVRQDCGSCHGITLHGGLGPALLPETLSGKDPDSLKATILHGRPGTAMPPWRRFVSEAEVEWIVTRLQKGFPLDR